jgi:hypothetical protein
MSIILFLGIGWVGGVGAVAIEKLNPQIPFSEKAFLNLRGLGTL